MSFQSLLDAWHDMRDQAASLTSTERFDDVQLQRFERHIDAAEKVLAILHDRGHKQGFTDAKPRRQLRTIPSRRPPA